MSKLLSAVEGITLEHYFLLQRLERVKELIRYDELIFSEIAFRHRLRRTAIAAYGDDAEQTTADRTGRGRGMIPRCHRTTFHALTHVASKPSSTRSSLMPVRLKSTTLPRPSAGYKRISA